MELVVVAAASVVAAIVNAIAGGGSLITFPALVAVGVPPKIASLTNTVAMCPGYFSATVAQRAQLVGQGRRAAWLVPLGAVGGVGGALLLLTTRASLFDIVVPALVLFASALLAFQDQIRAFLVRPKADVRARHAEAWAALPVGLAAIYGGYFGAALGVIVIAALAIALDENLIKLNALKQVISLAVNVSAAVVFVVSGRVAWSYAGVMAAAALVGGAIGGALASRVPARLLRWAIVVIGVAVSVVYGIKAATS